MKKSIKYVLFVLFIVALFCGYFAYKYIIVDMKVAEAHKVLEQSLKDLDSAKYRNEFISKDKYSKNFTVCGEINAKNSFGAYIGYERYYWDSLTANGFIDNTKDPINKKMFEVIWKAECAKHK